MLGLQLVTLAKRRQRVGANDDMVTNGITV
jgi:hypothetical protein